MEFDLDNDHPLAEAIRGIQTNSEEVWVVLKTPGKPSYLLASLTKWELGTHETHLEFETWERYMERKAQMAGL